MVKAVLFDMDGVLVDSQPFHFNVDREVLARSGNPVSQEVVQNYAGMSSRDRWTKFKNDFALVPSVDELIATHVSVIMELLDKADLQAIPCIPQLLDSLRGRGMKLAVASSSSYEFIYKMLDKINIRDAFDVILSGEDMPNSKPAPDIFLRAAEMVGCAPADCVVVEDAASGVAASVAAGIRCVGFKNINSGAQDLSPADWIVEDFADLLASDFWLEGGGR